MWTLSLGDDASRPATLADTLATDRGDLELIHGPSQETGDRRLPGPRVGHVEDAGCWRARRRHRRAAVGRRRVDDLVAANDGASVRLGRWTPLDHHRR